MATETETAAALLERTIETNRLMGRGTHPIAREDTVADGIEKFYTLDEVAHVTGYSIRSIRRFVAEGTLEAERWGREYRVSTPALKAFIESRRRAEPPAGPHRDSVAGQHENEREE
ncbi:MAG: helix-turn-helix domain-containing protein [Methanospirillum sp.]